MRVVGSIPGRVNQVNHVSSSVVSVGASRNCLKLVESRVGKYVVGDVVPLSVPYIMFIHL